MTEAETFEWNLQSAVEDALQDMMGEDIGATAKHVLERLRREYAITALPA